MDAENKIEKIFDKYFAPIPGPVLITAANLVKAAATMALAKPQLTGRINQELLKVEKARYQTAECRNIAHGHTIESFDRFFEQIEDKETTIALVKRQLKNTSTSIVIPELNYPQIVSFLNAHEYETRQGTFSS